VAVAEYETLRQSIHQAKMIGGSSTHNYDDDDDDHDGDENSKTTTKRQKTNFSRGEDEDDDDGALTERVRLSLLRLPSDTILSTSSSSSSSRGRSNAAWRHVVDTLSTWSIRWKEEEEVRRTIKDDDNESSLMSTKFNTHEFHSSSSSNLVDPDQVADWAMSSWTAILLLRGEMDYNRSTDPMHAGHQQQQQQQQHFDNDSIEIRLATMLSNGHCRHDNGNNSNTNTTAVEELTHAVKCRIDNLLSPEIIVSLNEIHLFSLGRLLSLFHNRQDAIEHIVKSIIKCSSCCAMATSTTDKGGGLNLFVGMEQLSCLLAVYVSCCCATSSTTTTTMSMTTLSSSSIASNIERDLRTKLDNDEVVRTILLENPSMKEGNHVVIDNSKTQAGHTPPPPSSATIESVKRRAISFLQLILCATAHLVGGCCKQ
jgi:energy-coupling factor transporter transmembrane protein EcfT